MRLVLLLLATLTFTAPVRADTGSVRLGNAVVEFDATHWRATDLSGVASVLFTCVAADCPDEPHVYAVTSATPADGGQAAFFGREPYGNARSILPGPDGNGRIAVTASARWSGCRARDLEILTAYATDGKMAYHFTTSIFDGCNFGPALPEVRFIELLAGLKPATE